MFRPLKIVLSVAWSRNCHWAYIWSNEGNLIVEVSGQEFEHTRCFTELFDQLRVILNGFFDLVIAFVICIFELKNLLMIRKRSFIYRWPLSSSLLGISFMY